MENYTVYAAHYCGNTWELSAHGTDLIAALDEAEKVTGFPHVAVYDADDPERGDVSDEDLDDLPYNVLDAVREARKRRVEVAADMDMAARNAEREVW